MKEYRTFKRNRYGGENTPVSNDRFSEAEGDKTDVKDIIKTVINTSWSGSNEDQMKILTLMKGIATSDEKISNDFMKAIDKATSSMKDDWSDKLKEGKIITSSKMKEGRRVEKYEYVLPTWSLSYIINGDHSSLDRKEMKQVDDFMDEVYRDFGSGHWNVDDNEYFSHKNDIDNLGATVVDARYIVIS